MICSLLNDRILRQFGPVRQKRTGNNETYSSLYSRADDVAATRRAIARQDGSVVLVGHCWAGRVISEAGNDPKVAGLVYIAALVPDGGSQPAMC